VVVATPLEFVTTAELPELRVPQAAPPLVVKITGSPATTTAVLVLTVAVTVEVLTPSAGMGLTLAVVVTTLGVPGAGLLVWSMVDVALLPVPVSVALR
jgi:hypothetical protein